jgi:hypothetical protein
MENGVNSLLTQRFLCKLKIGHLGDAIRTRIPVESSYLNNRIKEAAKIPT